MRFPGENDREVREVEQRVEAEGVKPGVVGRQAEVRPANPEERQRLRKRRNAQHDRDDDETIDVPRLQLP